MDEIPDSKYDGALVIILDTPTEDMVCDDRFRLAAKTIRFDHHLFTKKYTDCEVIDSSYESCSGLVADFAVESGLTVSSEAATALYTGIVTDSGRFRFDATSSDTFRRAAFLMKCGIKLESIYGNLYDTDFESVVLRAKFALMIRLTENKVGYIYSTKKDLEELGVSAFEAARGFVNTMADITGVKIWVAFAEADEGILCELRSSSYNINPVAVKYGGGGHAKASGATVPNREIAMKMLKDLDRMAQSE